MDHRGPSQVKPAVNKQSVSTDRGRSLFILQIPEGH